jgi:hypothetical protein
MIHAKGDPVRALGRVAVVTALTVSLAGCSRGTDPSSSSTPSVDPLQLVTQASANAKAAASVHIRGTGQCPEGGFVVDMDLRKDGLAAGSVKFGPDNLSVVATNDALYVNATSDFWSSQFKADSVRAIGSRWVRFPKGANPCVTALSNYSTVMANYLGFDGSPRLLSGSRYAGEPARQVGVGPDVSYWIATHGTLLPLNVHIQSTSTEINMNKWNDDLSVVVPPPTDVIDGKALR